MRNHTVTLFFVLLVVLFAALFFFWNHQHNLHAQNVYHGRWGAFLGPSVRVQGPMLACQVLHQPVSFPREICGSRAILLMWTYILHVPWTGGMSQETKEKYLKQGIDCQETYELQVRARDGQRSCLRTDMFRVTVKVASRHARIHLPACKSAFTFLCPCAQGYEAPETILRMFSLSQHDFYNLNPGVGECLPCLTVPIGVSAWSSHAPSQGRENNLLCTAEFSLQHNKACPRFSYPAGMNLQAGLVICVKGIWVSGQHAGSLLCCVQVARPQLTPVPWDSPLPACTSPRAHVVQATMQADACASMPGTCTQGVSKLSSSMDWFWPSMAVAAAVVGFFASYVMHHYRSSDSASKQHQHGHAHAHGGATA